MPCVQCAASHRACWGQAQGEQGAHHVLHSGNEQRLFIPPPPPMAAPPRPPRPTAGAADGRRGRAAAHAWYKLLQAVTHSLRGPVVIGLPFCLFPVYSQVYSQGVVKQSTPAM